MEDSNNINQSNLAAPTGVQGEEHPPMESSLLQSSRLSQIPFEIIRSSRFRNTSSSPSVQYKPAKDTTTESDNKGSIPIPFETLLVSEEKDNKDIQCGICLNILSAPKQCKNGHIFCQECILHYIQNVKSECPVCRDHLTEATLGRNLLLEKHLRLLKVHCKYHFCRDEENKDWISDKEGCPEICHYESLLQHERECGYGFVRCKFSTKCDGVRRKDLAKHEQECPFRPSECSHCSTPVEVNKMDEHLEVCKMIDVTCTKCEMVMKRGELEAHLKEKCPEELISCQFSDSGCEAKLLRKELAAHLAESVPNHLSMMKKAFDQQMEQMKTQYETSLKVRDDKIRKLERALTENDVRVEWRIKNWSSTRKKTYIQSDKFTFADFTWFIGFYTDGDNEDSRGFISIYLFLDVSSLPKGKNVTVEFMLTFINHKDANETIRKEFKTTFPIKGGQGWGDRKAIKATKISEESGFLKQDTLFVEATVSQRKVQWTFNSH